jgi:L-fuculose-phosphate aldolase
LAEFGRAIAHRGLTAGPGGNISARDGDMLWVKPSGMAMEELTSETLCRVSLDTGEVEGGEGRPTSELPMHLAIYRACPDVTAVFHTHSPWASGVISANREIKPMFAEVVADLGGLAVVPYLLTGSDALAQAVADAAREHGTIFMKNHGVVTVGKTMKQAYWRGCVAEDAAKAFVAAAIVGEPEFLSREQIEELRSLEAGAYRQRIAEESP